MSWNIDNIPNFTLPLPPPYAAVIAAALKSWNGNFTMINMDADPETRYMVDIFANLLEQYAVEQELSKFN